MYVSFPMDATVELNCCDERNKAIRKSNSKKKCVITGLGVTVVLATVILVRIDLRRKVWNNEEPCSIFQARISFSSLSAPASTVSELITPRSGNGGGEPIQHSCGVLGSGADWENLRWSHH